MQRRSCTEHKQFAWRVNLRGLFGSAKVSTVCATVFTVITQALVLAQPSPEPAKPVHTNAPASQSQSNIPPRYIWSPPQGYLFVEGNCGSDDQTLGWMTPLAPQALRESKMIMFSSGKDWEIRFREACKHFTTRWSALKGRKVIVVPGDYGRLRDDEILVAVPNTTPFAAGTFEEAIYLQGYTGGYMDFRNLRESSVPPVTGPRGLGWQAGWTAAQRRTK